MKYKVRVAKEKCDELLVQTWNDLRKDLYEGKVAYNELDKLKQYTFLKQFDDMFSLMEENLKICLADINYLCRAVPGECYDDGSCYDYQRFIPRAEFRSLNRFNPPSEVFIYLGICDEIDNSSNFNRAEETCLKEIRAEKDSTVSICEFRVNETSVDKKLIDLSMADNIDYDMLIDEMNKISLRMELSEKINRNLQTKSREQLRSNISDKISRGQGNYYKVSKTLAKIYFKMISEDLFLPADGVERNYEYAPFHAFANYFRDKGFAGIIYKSTVNPGNKNLVLFDVHDVICYGDIRVETYS